MLNVCMVRVGSRYGPEYVAILSDMLARNLSEIDVVPWCITDDPDTLPEGINAIDADPRLPGWWAKLQMFSPTMPWADGDRIVYFDLDSAIVGRLEPLVETKGIIRDWNWDCFNSSVMVWDHGDHRQVWDNFDPEAIPADKGDQEWITEQAPDFPVLPAEWCVSYRKSAVSWPPDGAKVVCFHGSPKPHEVTDGWVPDIWRIGGFTQLPAMDGANVSEAVIAANVRANIKRPLPWFSRWHPQPKPAVIVCGGPSLKDSIPQIRRHKARGARIVSVNNTLSYLMDRGIKPDVHVILDARPQNAGFVEAPPEGIRYLIASQCDGAVFDALADREVVVWHNMTPGMEPIFEPLIVAMMTQPGARPVELVPGGGTVGLRAMMLCHLSGYRAMHIYGMDGSFKGGQHHAYAQALNDVDRAIEVQLGGGRRYACARWMVRQAHEFKDAWTYLAGEGVRLHVHGDGLIPDMARVLQAERRTV